MGSSVFAACYVHISELTACLVFFLCPMFTLTSSQPTCHTRLEQKQPHFRVVGGSTKFFFAWTFGGKFILGLIFD